jgi:hypothetical protein
MDQEFPTYTARQLELDLWAVATWDGEPGLKFESREDVKPFAAAMVSKIWMM